MFFFFTIKSFIALYATSDDISISSFATVIDAPVGIVRSSFSFVYSIATGVIQKFLKNRKNNKNNHNQISMLERSKLNNIDSMISKALVDNEMKNEKKKRKALE